MVSVQLNVEDINIIKREYYVGFNIPDFAFSKWFELHLQINEFGILISK